MNLKFFFLGGDNVSDPELKLSLSSGYDNWREGSAKKTWLDKKAHSCARIIIDLEESIERVSNEGEKDAPSFRYTTPTPHSGSKHQPGFSVLSDAVISSGVKKDLQDGTADSHTLLDDLKCHQEQVDLNKGTCIHEVIFLTCSLVQLSSFYH